ncbi:unnamed protein product, partial [Medioppia subpectinata]
QYTTTRAPYEPPWVGSWTLPPLTSAPVPTDHSFDRYYPPIDEMSTSTANPFIVYTTQRSGSRNTENLCERRGEAVNAGAKEHQ